MAVQHESCRLEEQYACPGCSGRVFLRPVMDCLEMFVVQILPGYRETRVGTLDVRFVLDCLLRAGV
jgi:DNA-directed RNA polymerase subunit RPC12/RpoP